MKVSVAYATSETQAWQSFEVTEGYTVKQVIEASGFLDLFPEIDLSKQKVGIYGKFTKLSNQVIEGDRVEVYLPISRKLDEDDDEDE